MLNSESNQLLVKKMKSQSKSIFIYFCLYGLCSFTYAVEPHIEKSCSFSSEFAANYAQLLNDSYTIIANAKKINDQATIEKFKGLIQKGMASKKNERYEIFQKILKDNDYASFVQVSAAIDRAVYLNAEFLAITESKNTSELSFKRMLYEECISIGIKADLEFNNSPAQIQRIEEMNRLQREMNKPTQPQQQQNITVNPSRPLHCTSMPDGPGSTRMITTCF